ncbi:UDP-glucose/GDP-mannose dehydrogenase family protein [Candidatus Uhrbacteria bacterium]|nr:UDP-glucose/GDP-mannose dehydrogenase family protein [Candidatus Uhrbacteria bacterium]
MQANSPLKVAVMGVGWVGSAVANYFTERGLEPVLFDPPKKLGSPKDLERADVMFMCVPTPYDEAAGGFDLAYIKRAIEVIPGNKIIVIKSTVLPGTTEKLQNQYPRHRFLFNPEFLRQVSADADFRNPERQIIGTTAASADLAEQVLALLPPAPFTRVIAATEAETVKYFGNCFLALKVVFANQVFDLCRRLGIDYDTVRASAAADSRIGSSHLKIAPDGYRGYGGGCFPKDMKAFIQLGDLAGVDLALLKTCERLNAELVKIGEPKKAVAAG